MSVTIFKNNGYGNFFMSSPGGTLAVLRVGDLIKPGAGSSHLKAIITDHAIEEAANANVMYAADGYTYLHVPGDKIGSFTVSGLTFGGLCGDRTSTSGFVQIMEWYRKNRVSNPRQLGDIRITLSGNKVCTGYLGSCSLRVADAANRLFSFSLPMYLAPTPPMEFSPYGLDFFADDYDPHEELGW